jgi:cell division protein ZapA
MMDHVGGMRTEGGWELGVKRSVAVQIAGQRYFIKSDADEAHVLALARFVDEKMDELRGATRSGSLHQVAILAALNIADDLFKQVRESRDLKSSIRERATRALQYLEQEEQGT